ncbi:MAG: hypothetical protein GC131_02475 [Alphaproteobacteria bacterium]|nr:hypothetical protein [Alphaproteobacteria bacterium]
MTQPANPARTPPRAAQPRNGPRPLPQHLLTAGMLWMNWPLAWAHLKNGSPGSNTSSNAAASPASLPVPPALHAAANKLPEAEILAALQAEACARYGKFLSGIKAYHRHAARRNLPEMPVLWQQGTTRLLDYAPALDARAPQLVVIPSLINRYHVLDLAPARSMLRWLAALGIRPLVVDWDEPGETERGFGADGYIHRLAHMLDWLTEQRTRVHLLGYCLGGTLAAALAHVRPGLVRSLIALAAPWDFHAGGGHIAPRARQLTDMLQPFFAQGTGGVFPVEALQALLTGFQPAQVIEKFMQFPALAPADQHHFVLVEDWLNDGVPLSAPFARDLFEKFYAENRPGTGTWRALGRVIDPAAIAAPALVVVPAQDRIVPPGSARALAAKMPNATLCEPQLGHVGMVVGREAGTQVWRRLADWVLSPHDKQA